MRKTEAEAILERAIDDPTWRLVSDVRKLHSTCAFRGQEAGIFDEWFTVEQSRELERGLVFGRFDGGTLVAVGGRICVQRDGQWDDLASVEEFAGELVWTSGPPLVDPMVAGVLGEQPTMTTQSYLEGYGLDYRGAGRRNLAMHAARLGRRDVVSMCVDLGADPLDLVYHAALGGQLDVVRDLLAGPLKARWVQATRFGPLPATAKAVIADHNERLRR